MREGNKSIISNVFWKFAERILAQFVSLIVSVVLARILLPETYGIVAMVSVFITFLDVFVTNGLPTALIQKTDSDNLDFSSVFYINLLISICLYIILFFLANTIASFYEIDSLIPIIRVMGLRIIIASINSIQHSYVSKHMMFKKYFWSTMFGTIISGIMGVLFAVKGFGVWALVAQYMTNTIVNSILLWFSVKWRPTLCFSWRRVCKLVSFGWKVLFEAIAEVISTQIRSLLIGKVYSSSDLAYYSKAQQFPGLLVDNVCVSISSVLFPAMSNNQDKEGYVLQLLRKSTSILSYILFPMMTGLALVSEPFIRVVLTDRWIECVPYMQIFCFTQGATVGMITRHQALMSIGRSDVYMVEHIAYRIFFLALVFFVYKKSVMAIALTSVFGSLFMIIAVMITSKQYNGYGFKDQIFDVLPTLICCLIMAVSAILVSKLLLSDFIILVVQLFIGILVYILSSAVLKVEGYRYCKEYIIKITKRIKDVRGGM